MAYPKTVGSARSHGWRVMYVTESAGQSRAICESPSVCFLRTGALIAVEPVSLATPMGSSMRSAIRHSKIAVLCTTALLAACSKGDNSADSSKAADSAKAGMSATSAASTTGASEAGWTDPNILAFLDDANVADSAAGSVAATKATSADVKSFGKQMVRDHHAMRKEGQDVAKKLNLTPQPKAGDTMAAESGAFRDSLSSMSAGPAWDRTYIDHEVAGHEKVLTTAQSAAGATRNADIKTLITKSAPKVQAHLDKAKAIQAKLGGAK